MPASCTAPVKGHRSQTKASACPVHGARPSASTPPLAAPRGHLDASFAPGDTIWVEDAWGDVDEYQYGILNDENRRLFLNGQCFALAVALCERFETTQVYVESTPDDEYEDCTDEELEEEFGERPRQPLHVFAVAPDGTPWDVDGPADIIIAREIAVDRGGEDATVELVSIDEARRRFGGYLVDQHEDFARSVAPLVVASARDRD